MASTTKLVGFAFAASAAGAWLAATAFGLGTEVSAQAMSAATGGSGRADVLLLETPTTVDYYGPHLETR